MMNDKIKEYKEYIDEYSRYEKEKSASMNALSSKQFDYARRLKNGLGEDIINTLNNPPKPNKWITFKMWFNRTFKKK